MQTENIAQDYAAGVKDGKDIERLTTFLAPDFRRSSANLYESNRRAGRYRAAAFYLGRLRGLNHRGTPQGY